MKKRLLLYIILCLILVLSSCHGGNETSGDTSGDVSEEVSVIPEGYSEITFTGTRGVKFITETKSGSLLEDGSEVTFSLSVSPFYTGNAVVTANGSEIKPTDGVYSVLLSESTVIEVGGIKLKANSISGTGDSTEDPLVLTTPIDLLYVAERVNSGDTFYRGAYYMLDADISFGGEEFETIGDGRDENAYFEGYFDGNGHIISDFVINSEGRQYVGLFGILQANVANSEGGTVIKLGLKDYSITCIGDGSLFCGSVAGYSLGANIILCSTENGRIEIHGNTGDFAYAGGLIGLQQGLDYFGLTYISAVSYSTVDTLIDCREGMTYAAGGITGYLSASVDGTNSVINNCISKNDVLGAIISGGIAGYIGDRTCVTNCYSTGNISSQTSVINTDTSSEFCHTYSGGVVGYALHDSVVAQSFATGRIYCRASLGKGYEHSGGILGFSAEIPEGIYTSNKATVFECVYAECGKSGEIDLTSEKYLTSALHFTSCDWVFGGGYPTVNTSENEDYTFAVDISFPGSEGVRVEGFNAYMPLSFWYLEGSLPNSLTGSDGDTHTSYGYYFDEALKLAVPESFVPTRDITLYAAVADYSEVAGDYAIISGKNDSLHIKLNVDGSFIYTDGGTDRTSYFSYNGNDIVLKNARLARYSEVLTGLEKYGFTSFTARVSDGVLTVTGGVINLDNENSVTAFPSDMPLRAVNKRSVLCGSYRSGGNIYRFYPDGTGVRTSSGSSSDFEYTLKNGNIGIKYASSEASLSLSSLSDCDIFLGEWQSDDLGNRCFEFDGNGSFVYRHYGYTTKKVGELIEATKVLYTIKRGSYTISGDRITLSGGMTGSGRLEDGAISLTFDGESATFHTKGSYVGRWIYPDYGISLELKGICSGIGEAEIEYYLENGAKERYDLTYAFDDRDRDLICLYQGDDVYGVMYYVPGTDTLSSAMYVAPLGSFMQNIQLMRIDALDGEWISDDGDFASLSFNGLGPYPAGSVTLDGGSYSYSLDNGRTEGSFICGNTLYTVSFDSKNGTLLLNNGKNTAEYHRKDIFASLVFEDTDGRIYTFDGRGELSKLGSMTITDGGNTQSYKYRVQNGRLTVYDGTRQAEMLIDSGKNVFTLALDGSRELTLRTSFSGTWAMSGSLENLVISNAGCDGLSYGSINGINTVFTPEGDCLTFVYDGGKYFITAVNENDLVISTDPDWFLTADMIYCAKLDDMFGTWTNSLGASYDFDGMSGSSLTNGSARSKLDSGYINYYYTLDTYGQYVLWTYDEDGRSSIYRLVMCDPDTRRAFIKGDKAFTVEQGDNLYDSTFLDASDGLSYTFDGFGKAFRSDGKEYTYTLISLDQSTGKASVTLTSGEENFGATLDFATYGNFTLTKERN